MSVSRSAGSISASASASKPSAGIPTAEEIRYINEFDPDDETKEYYGETKRAGDTKSETQEIPIDEPRAIGIRCESGSCFTAEVQSWLIDHEFLDRELVARDNVLLHESNDIERVMMKLTPCRLQFHGASVFGYIQFKNSLQFTQISGVPNIPIGPIRRAIRIIMFSESSQKEYDPNLLSHRVISPIDKKLPIGISESGSCVQRRYSSPFLTFYNARNLPVDIQRYALSEYDSRHLSTSHYQSYLTQLNGGTVSDLEKTRLFNLVREQIRLLPNSMFDLTGVRRRQAGIENDPQLLELRGGGGVGKGTTGETYMDKAYIVVRLLPPGAPVSSEIGFWVHTGQVYVTFAPTFEHLAIALDFFIEKVIQPAILKWTNGRFNNDRDHIVALLVTQRLNVRLYSRFIPEFDIVADIGPSRMRHYSKIQSLIEALVAVPGKEEKESVMDISAGRLRRVPVMEDAEEWAKRVQTIIRTKRSDRKKMVSGVTVEADDLKFEFDPCSIVGEVMPISSVVRVRLHSDGITLLGLRNNMDIRLCLEWLWYHKFGYFFVCRVNPRNTSLQTHIRSQRVWDTVYSCAALSDNSRVVERTKRLRRTDFTGSARRPVGALVAGETSPSEPVDIRNKLLSIYMLQDWDQDWRENLTDVLPAGSIYTNKNVFDNAMLMIEQDPLIPEGLFYHIISRANEEKASKGRTSRITTQIKEEDEKYESLFRSMSHDGKKPAVTDLLFSSQAQSWLLSSSPSEIKDYQQRDEIILSILHSIQANYMKTATSNLSQKDRRDQAISFARNRLLNNVGEQHLSSENLRKIGSPKWRMAIPSRANLNWNENMVLRNAGLRNYIGTWIETLTSALEKRFLMTNRGWLFTAQCDFERSTINVSIMDIPRSIYFYPMRRAGNPSIRYCADLVRMRVDYFFPMMGIVNHNYYIPTNFGVDPRRSAIIYSNAIINNIKENAFSNAQQLICLREISQRLSYERSSPLILTASADGTIQSDNVILVDQLCNWIESEMKIRYGLVDLNVLRDREFDPIPIASTLQEQIEFGQSRLEKPLSVLGVDWSATADDIDSGRNLIAKNEMNSVLDMLQSSVMAIGKKNTVSIYNSLIWLIRVMRVTWSIRRYLSLPRDYIILNTKHITELSDLLYQLGTMFTKIQFPDTTTHDIKSVVGTLVTNMPSLIDRLLFIDVPPQGEDIKQLRSPQRQWPSISQLTRSHIVFVTIDEEKKWLMYLTMIQQVIQARQSLVAPVISEMPKLFVPSIVSDPIVIQNTLTRYFSSRRDFGSITRAYDRAMADEVGMEMETVLATGFAPEKQSSQSQSRSGSRTRSRSRSPSVSITGVRSASKSLSRSLADSKTNKSQRSQSRSREKKSIDRSRQEIRRSSSKRSSSISPSRKRSQSKSTSRTTQTQMSKTRSRSRRAQPLMKRKR